MNELFSWYPVTIIVVGAAIIILWLWKESRESPKERAYDQGE